MTAGKWAHLTLREFMSRFWFRIGTARGSLLTSNSLLKGFAVMQVLSVCNSISFRVLFHLPLENTLSIFTTFKLALKLLSVTDADPNFQRFISIITFRQKENSFPRIYLQNWAGSICAILLSVRSLSYNESSVSSPENNLLFQVSVGIDLGSVWLLKH